MTKRRPATRPPKKPLREQLENNLLTLVVVACVATGGTVYGVVNYFDREKIALAQQTEKAKWEPKTIELTSHITELNRDIGRFKNLITSNGDKSIVYSRYSILDATEAPAASRRLYDGVVLVQPKTDTRYFNPYKEESIFDVSDEMAGHVASPTSKKADETAFRKKYSKDIPMQFVWRGKTTYDVSPVTETSASGETHQKQCSFKKVFHYFSVSRTPTDSGENYDSAIISKIKNRFTGVIDPEDTELDQIFLGRQGRIFVLELKFACHNVRLNDDPTPGNLYLIERKVIFPVRGGYVTVNEFVPSTDRIVSDPNVLVAESTWWSYFRVFKN